MQWLRNHGLMTWWAALSAIARATTARVLQVAADGSWETAVVAQDGAVARGVIARVASMATRDVAAEVLWPGQSFVGVRWSLDELSEASQPPDPLSALASCTGSWSFQAVGA